VRKKKEVKEIDEVNEVEEALSGPLPPCFSEVRILKGLREQFLGSAESKGVISLVFSAVTRGARKC
jgi:hypothetical protein